MAKVFSPHPDNKVTDQTAEVVGWRRRLREAQYLSQPLQRRPPNTINGEHVDGRVFDFSKIAKINKKSYYDQKISGRKVDIKTIYK